MTTINTRKPSTDQWNFRQDLVAVIGKHGANLKPDELLAAASHLVGQLLAMQDQKTMSPDRALLIVEKNIEQGNREVLEKLMEPQGKS